MVRRMIQMMNMTAMMSMEERSAIGFTKKSIVVCYAQE